MLNFFKNLGLFKIFFLIVLPLVFAFFVWSSWTEGNLGYDIQGYLIGFGAVYLVVGLAVFFNRKK